MQYSVFFYSFQRAQQQNNNQPPFEVKTGGFMKHPPPNEAFDIRSYIAKHCNIHEKLLLHFDVEFKRL